MKIQVVPSDKTIVLDNVAVHPCTHVDLSWIPSDVHGMFFDTTKGKGFIEYNEDAVKEDGTKKWSEEITEIGIWQQAVTDHANEQTLAAAAYEAARNHLAEVKEYRTAQLVWSDWTRLDDVTLAADKKAEWATYRQALRDLPATIAADANLTAKALADNHSHSAWPTKPT